MTDQTDLIQFAKDAADQCSLDPYIWLRQLNQESGLQHYDKNGNAAAPVVCGLINSDRCEADGLVVKGNAPVLTMCRKLIDAGYDPDRPLEAYRGDVLCLRVSRIGYGAKFTIKDSQYGTPALRRWYERTNGMSTASPMRPNAIVATARALALGTNGAQSR